MVSLAHKTDQMLRLELEGCQNYAAFYHGNPTTDPLLLMQRRQNEWELAVLEAEVARRANAGDD